MMNRSLVLVVAFALASCASAPENLFVPVSATAPGASSVDMLVATTRRAAANPGALYSGERGDGLSFANVVVSIPPERARQAGEIQWPKSSPGNPATDFVATSVSRLDARATRAWLDAHGSAANKHRVLIFVHGYNNRFNDAVFRAVQLIHDSDADRRRDAGGARCGRRRVRKRDRRHGRRIRNSRCLRRRTTRLSRFHAGSGAATRGSARSIPRLSLTRANWRRSMSMSSICRTSSRGTPPITTSSSTVPKWSS